MAKKIMTNIGDIFCVTLDNGNKKYLQLIAFDLTQLNSDVIRVFSKIYPNDTNPDLVELINQEVEFYTHCITKLGIKMKIWEKIGNVLEVGETKNILFRGSSDSGSKPGQQIKISNNWYVWRINDINFTKVGKLEGENRNAEIGIVVNPYDVLERIKTGRYSFFYPSFE
jgi:Immunity protein 26